MLTPKGCGQNSRRFRDAQTGWPHRRSAPDTLRRCASRRATRDPNTDTRRTARSHSPPKPTRRDHSLGSVASGECLMRRKTVPTLSERQRACLSGPLGAAPSSGGRTRNKPAGCLSVASFRLARVRPQPRRAPMQRIGARQGVLCFGYFHLDKQMKVTRTAVRNPKSNCANIIHSKRASSGSNAFLLNGLPLNHLGHRGLIANAYHIFWNVRSEPCHSSATKRAICLTNKHCLTK